MTNIKYYGIKDGDIAGTFETHSAAIRDEHKYDALILAESWDLIIGARNKLERLG